MKIEEAHLSLDREHAEKMRQRANYVEQLNFYGGQKRQARVNDQYRAMMERDADLANMEKYVQNELRNERNYRERFEAANTRMLKNANHLMSSIKHDTGSRQHANQ